MAQIQARGTITSLDALFAQHEAHINNIVNYIGPVIPDIDEEPITGLIFNTLSQERKLEMCTNFSQQELVNLVQQMQPHVVAASCRGPKAKSPPCGCPYLLPYMG
jgi:hypothetical protein